VINPMIDAAHSPVAPVLTVAGMSKMYGRFAALDDVGFSLRSGEILGLIGPNGAGKTTLFECLAGLLPFERGTVKGADGPLTARERTAQLFYLPDGIAPWPMQTVAWILDFAIGFFGGDPARRASVIGMLDLASLLDAPLGTLSKGQRKRALLAVALLTPQPVLLVDEPFDGLDLRQNREVANGLRAHAAAGRTLLLSIHQISDAARVCDRFVLLSGGRVCGEGTIDELAAQSAVRGGASARDLEEVFLALT
jgi:ABC-type multidrug transport system ATPase subunit